jgi:flagella basal body P-ring formation protein FlgA
MMNHLSRILRSLPGVLVVALAAMGSLSAAAAHAQTTITLNISAKFESAAAPVKLASVAQLAGPESSRFGEIVLLERADAKPAVALADVRAKLQTAGANFGAITLRGATCRIELPASVPATKAAPAERKRTGPDYQVVDVAGPPTLRTAIARRLAAMHEVAHDAIQIAFDDKDALTLATPYTERQIVQVQPAASTSSSRIPLRISVFAGDTVVADHRLTADVLLRREVLIAQRDIDRREIIADADVRLEPRWVSPGETPPDRAAIIGSQARAKIKQGEAFSGGDLESPVLIKRGDVVYVQVLSGSIVVQARTRALGPGREGETIAFQMEGADDSFMARVAGRGRAVMLAAPAMDAPPVQPAATSQPTGPQVRR